MKNILSSLAALTIIVAASTPAFSMNCVAYARQVTGMNLSGDAWHWWDSASGVYARGHQPVPGAVMVFARTRQMSHGHVAVVRQVVDSRQILIDQANWLTGRMRGTVTKAVAARDVSSANDWSAVEVQWAQSTDFGRVNPIRGFVYGSNNGRAARGLQDAVLHETSAQNSGFQNAGFSLPQSYSSHSHRHHVVFRHAPVQAHCARPTVHKTTARKTMAHKSRATPSKVQHVSAHQRDIHPAAGVTKHAALTRPVAKSAASRPITVGTQELVQHAAAQPEKPAAVQKPVTQQASAPLAVRTPTTAAHVVSAAAATRPAIPSAHPIMQKAAASPKTATSKVSAQSAAAYVSPHDSASRQTN